MIYLDSAATSLHRPKEVGEAVLEAMGNLGNSGRSSHAAALGAGRLIYDARCEICDFFHGWDPSCVIFTANSTESLNFAIRGLLHPGDHVITSVMEHNSVLRPLYERESQGVTISFLPLNECYEPDLTKLEEEIGPNTKAIVINHASNVTGAVTDLKEVHRIAEKHGLLLIVDASQSAGTLPIDVQELGIDVLCFTGHKSLMGPQGTGGMVLRPGLEIDPTLSGGTGVQSFLKKQPEEYPAHLEAGTLNGHGIAGLRAAIRFLKETGVEKIHAREMALADRFVLGVYGIPGISVYGAPEAEVRCPIVSLNLWNVDSGTISDELSETYGIATRPGAHCAPLLHEELGTVQQGLVRFSFSYFTTEEEVDAAIHALSELAEEYGNHDEAFL